MSEKAKNIVFFILISLSFLIFEIIYPLLGFNYNSFSTKTKILLMILKYFVFMIILFIRYRKYLIIKWKEFIKEKKNIINIAFKWWSIGFLLMIVIIGYY